tara:strand:+ start:209 stop:544 length:336 start_codon:yes stop_codon:yes gene_type:complete
VVEVVEPQQLEELEQIHQLVEQEVQEHQMQSQGQIQHMLVVVEVEQDILVIQLLLKQEELVVLEELVAVKQDQILELIQVQLVLTLVVEVVVLWVVLDVTLVEQVAQVSWL